jgi:hypothetical protein
MADIAPIPVADLLADAENPRLPKPNLGQREVLQAMAYEQGRKLQALVRDIVRYGLNPSELDIVMPFEGTPGRYVVLEGNRRLTALKALENPELLVGAVSRSALAEVRKLSKQYQNAPIESIPCIIVKNRDEARHWIELRHGGELEGAGIVRWNRHEIDRFRARSGALEIHTQALEFLVKRGDLTPEDRRRVPATSFKRLIESPDIRNKIGVEAIDGRLKMLADEVKVAKALLYIAQDLASGHTITKDIYYKKDRLKYANKIPADIVVTPTLKSGEGIDITTGVADVRPKVPRAKVPARKRDKLIPRDCVLNITTPRLRDIEGELRKLSLEDHTNAVSVLFRVFLELSADEYVDRIKLDISINKPLAAKLQKVTSDLLSRKKLTQQQARPVRRACQKDSFLSPSITLLHQYVHNQYMFPGPSDLRAQWDSLQPFVTAMFAP